MFTSFFNQLMILPSINKILSCSPIQKVYLNTNCWVRSPLWDLFWLHSGVWLGLIVFVFSSQPALEMFYMAGVFLFWISHRLSPFYIAWCTQSYSTVRASQPWRFLIFPAMLVLSVFVPVSYTHLTLPTILLV